MALGLAVLPALIFPSLSNLLNDEGSATHACCWRRSLRVVQEFHGICDATETPLAAHDATETLATHFSR
eukprot:3957342-Pyramimonas_sp.AAC.1